MKPGINRLDVLCFYWSNNFPQTCIWITLLKLRLTIGHAKAQTSNTITGLGLARSLPDP